MALRKRFTRMLLWTSAGAAAAYLYDPESGRGRRARLQDQAEARLRKVRREAERKGRYVQTTAEGKAEQLARSQAAPPPDDLTLVDKIKSEVLGQDRFREYPVIIDAVDGVVTMRGELADPSSVDEVRRAIEAVPGVREVQSLVHSRGTAAPNKDESIEASTQ